MLDVLAETIECLTANRIFYLTNRWCPRVNEEGKPVMFKVPFDEEEVWIMHPTLLAGIEEKAAQEGMFLVKFDIDHFMRKQAAKRPVSMVERWGQFYL